MQDALVYALGIAVSPVAIVATLVLLTCRRAVRNAVGFLVGWTVGVAALLLGFLVVVDRAGVPDSHPTWIAITELVLGAGFLLAAAAVWLRHQPNAAPWVEAVESFTTRRSAGLGIVLSGANPKVAALSLGAALSLTQAEAGVAVTAGTFALYCAIGIAGAVMPLAIYLVAPSQALSRLGAMRAWLERHEASVLIALGIVIGVLFLMGGLGGL